MKFTQKSFLNDLDHEKQELAVRIDKISIESQMLRREQEAAPMLVAFINNPAAKDLTVREVLVKIAQFTEGLLRTKTANKVLVALEKYREGQGHVQGLGNLIKSLPGATCVVSGIWQIEPENKDELVENCSASRLLPEQHILPEPVLSFPSPEFMGV